VKGKVSYQ